MTSLILYPLLSAVFFYLGSRATITSFLWSRYPRKLAIFFDCPACSGFWYSLGIGVVGGRVYNLDFLELPGDAPETWVVIALAGIVWTPLVAAIHQHALMTLGSAVPDESETETSIPTMMPEPNDATMPIPATSRPPLQPPPLKPPPDEPDSSTSEQA